MGPLSKNAFNFEEVDCISLSRDKITAGRVSYIVKMDENSHSCSNPVVTEKKKRKKTV